MRKFILISLANTFALFAASILFNGVLVHRPVAFLWAGIILGLVNLLIRPVLLLLTLPVNLLTLGLFTLVVNTWTVKLTAAVVPGMRIQGFITAFLTAILVSLCNWLVKKADQN